MLSAIWWGVKGAHPSSSVELVTTPLTPALSTPPWAAACENSFSRVRCERGTKMGSPTKQPVINLLYHSLSSPNNQLRSPSQLYKWADISGEEYNTVYHKTWQKQELNWMSRRSSSTTCCEVEAISGMCCDCRTGWCQPWLLLFWLDVQLHHAAEGECMLLIHGCSRVHEPRSHCLTQNN